MQTVRWIIVSLIIPTFVWALDPIQTEEANVAKAIGASEYTVVGFEKGKNDVAGPLKDQIKKTADTAMTHGKIKEIVVLTWADREYPAKGDNSSNYEIDLAEKRAKNLKTALSKDLAMKEKVNTYNMAKRPNMLQEVFKTSTYKVKASAETSGAAPNTQQDTGILGLNEKASKAMVLFITE